MSRAKYEDGCTGCEPAAMDMKTQTRLPEAHPICIGMAVAWAKTDRKTRKAWHSVTCLDSRRPKDIRLVNAFRAEMDREIRIVENKSGAWLMKPN